MDKRPFRVGWEYYPGLETLQSWLGILSSGPRDPSELAGNIQWVRDPSELAGNIQWTRDPSELAGNIIQVLETLQDDVFKICTL